MTPPLIVVMAAQTRFECGLWGISIRWRIRSLSGVVVHNAQMVDPINTVNYDHNLLSSIFMYDTADAWDLKLTNSRHSIELHNG